MTTATAPGGDEVRAAFSDAASWFTDVVGRIPDDRWTAPGLGSWNVRELAAHTARAFTTIEQYLVDPPAEATVDGAVAYFRAGMRLPGIHDAVAERGRQDAAALADPPAESLAAIAARGLAVVAATPDDAVCGSAVGGIRFSDYLVSRVFELTTHTCDLCDALGFDDRAPVSAMSVTLGLVAALAAEGDDGRHVLSALTGRSTWGPGASVLG